MRLQQVLEKYIPLIANMLVPASIFAEGLLSFLSMGGFSFETASIFHWAFYILSVLNLLILLNFIRGRLLFFMSVTVLAYILINYMKQRFGSGFSSEFWFWGIEVLTPLNLLVFYLFYDRRFLGKQSLFLLVGIVLQWMLLEFLGRGGFKPLLVWQGINLPSFFLFGVLVAWSLVYAVKDGRLEDYGVLFASLSIGCGFFYAAQASAVSLFFCMAQLMLGISMVYTLAYNHYYDDLTGFLSRNSYLLQSKRFPLKYSLGIICIDNYEKLALTLVRKKINTVVLMLSAILEDLNPEGQIYRYAADEFIVLYKKLDKKEAFALLDNIRRTVAGVSFEYVARKNPVKLTISCSVAEKKRSDSGAVEVLMRADKALRQTLKFSHNVTSQG